MHVETLIFQRISIWSILFGRIRENSKYFSSCGVIYGHFKSFTFLVYFRFMYDTFFYERVKKLENIIGCPV